MVISYDIEDDKRRGRVHRILKNFGQWVQYSVFECRLTRAQYLQMRHHLDNVIEKSKGDNLRVYILCEDCQKRIERIGGIEPRPEGSIIV
jgi:CRISPR-associated protein Cas2